MVIFSKLHEIAGTFLILSSRLTPLVSAKAHLEPSRIFGLPRVGCLNQCVDGCRLVPAFYQHTDTTDGGSVVCHYLTAFKKKFVTR